MSTTHEIVAGTTSPYDIDLKDNGATPSGSLTGSTVDLIIKDANGTQIPLTGNVTVQDGPNWRVRVSPDAADFTAGIYRGRVKVTDSGGKIAYFPNKKWDIWVVHSEA